MQNITYTIDAGLPLSLWRGIPAQLTIKGIPETSGDWLFLIDTDWIDGVVLSGTVTAEGSDLIVTLSAMNTVELAHAIQGHEVIAARATLTDQTSRVYLIPLTIRNRAIEGTPTPVEQYYTKPQIDALIAGITAESIGALPEPETAGTPGQVLTVTETGAAWEDLPAIDWSKAVTASGAAITPEAGKVYAHTLAAGDVLSIDTSGLGAKQADFELHLTQPATAVTFTFPAGIKWEADGVFSAENDAPDLSEGGRCYILTFRWTGSALLGNLAGAEVL